MHEYGLASSYQDYCALPVGVLHDFRLLMEGEAHAREREQRKAVTRGKR